MSRDDLARLPFMNQRLGIEERVTDLLKRLTLQEKLSLCAGKNLWSTKPVERLGIRGFRMVDGPNGLGAILSVFKKGTYFPSSICRTATWNPDLSRQFGTALAQEVRSIGYQMVLAPAVNIDRTPLGGRTFEYQTEDPYLNRKMAVAVVQGIQSQRVAACVKHFACNNQETNRTKVSSQVSERSLREIYLQAFEAVVREADAWSVMAAYNKVNGTYCCESHDLLTERLREEWGFRGFVVSDWYAANPTTSTEGCVNAGLSLEMPGGGSRYSGKALRTAFEAGKFSEDGLDRNLTGLLRVMFLVGLFDDEKSLPAGSRNTPEHQALARRIAEEGIVLLKNERDILPLKIEEVKRIAVLGPNADKKMGLKGGSSMVRPPYEVTPLKGLRERCGEKIELVRSPAEADVAVVFAGLSQGLLKGIDTEGEDKKSLELPSDQVALINSTADANPSTVVVLINGSPVTMDGWLEKVPTVVEAWYAGQEAGHAIAAILFGDVNPSGKLPLTFPRRLSDSPAHVSERTFPGAEDVHYDEGVFVGYRHFDARGIEPLFPFGHGLSYTKFAYENLRISGMKVSGDVTNAGDRAGSEVVQLYVHDPTTIVERPLKELKGFKKVHLDPGRTETVTFTLTEEDLSFWDEKTGRWTTEADEYDVLMGSSSRDIRLQGKLGYVE
jgi:beta-glucosidase